MSIKTSGKRTFATIVLMVASFMDIMDSTIVNVALPTIQRSLHTSPAQLEWTLGGYMIAFAMMLITGGRLGDIFGRQRTFLVGVAGFTFASLTASLAQSGDMLVAARIVQGAFAGVMIPQVLSCIQVMFAPKERGPIFGILGSISALGAVAGLVVGGWLVTINAFGTSWRSIFLINVPIGIALFITSMVMVPNSKSAHPLRLDIAGMLLAITTVFTIIFPLTNGRQAHWAWWIWSMLAASPIFLYVFILQQHKKMKTDHSPLLPIQLFKNRGFSSGLVVQLFFHLANGSYAFVIGLYLQMALHMSALSAGLTIMAIAVGSMAATPLGMTLAKRFGKSLVFAGGLMQAAGFAGVIHVISTHAAHVTGWELALPLGFAGAGLLLLSMALMNIALAGVPSEEAGAASGTLSTFQQIGFTLGIAVVGVIFFRFMANDSSPAGIQAATIHSLWLTIGAYICVGGAGLFMPRMPKKFAPKASAIVEIASIN